MLVSTLALSSLVCLCCFSAFPKYGTRALGPEPCCVGEGVRGSGSYVILVLALEWWGTAACAATRNGLSEGAGVSVGGGVGVICYFSVGA